MDWKAELPERDEDIVYRLKQTYLSLSVDEMSQLSETHKGFLRELFRLAEEHRPNIYDPSREFLELMRSRAREIEEINTAIEVVVRSRDQKAPIQYIANQFNFFSSPLPRSSEKSFTFGLPREMKNFTGRSDELGKLKDLIETQQFRTLKIAGTGGIGKTQLALNFSYRQLDSYKLSEGKEGFCAVVWFIAGTDEGIDNHELMLEQIQLLGEQLGFDSKALKFQSLITLIYKRLSDEYGPCLIVFDNAQNHRAISPYLPPSDMAVIITTRNNNDRDFDSGFKTVALNIFTESESLAYIQKILCVNHSNLYQHQDAILLANALGCFPLALTQALAYITTENIPLTGYLEEFGRQKSRYLQNPVPQGDHYQEDKNPIDAKYLSLPREVYVSQKATVWAVIQLSLRKITDPNAIQLLSACAYLASEVPIPKTLLRGWLPEDMEARQINQVITALRALSLLENGVEGESYKIHQVVQDVIKADIPKEERRSQLIQWAEVIIRTLKLPKSVLKIDKQARYIVYSPHTWLIGQQLIKIVNESAETSLQKGLGERPKEQDNLQHDKRQVLRAAIKMYEITGRAQTYRGQVALAKNSFAELLKFCREAPAEINPAVLVKYRLYHATTILASGEAEEAKSLLQKILDDSKTTYDIPDTLLAICLMNLGCAYYECGAPRTAGFRIQDARSKLRYLNSRHPKYLACSMNLATIEEACGGLASAEMIYKEILPIMRDTFGAGHSSVGLCIMGLGNVMFGQHNPKYAYLLYEDARKIFERQLDKQHAVIGRCYLNMGAVKISVRDLEGAQKHIDEAEIILNHALGDQHADMGRAMMMRALISIDRHEFNEALPVLKEALLILERSLPQNHADIGMCLKYLCTCTGRLWQYPEARDYLDRASKTLEDSYFSILTRAFDSGMYLTMGIPTGSRSGGY